MESLEIGIRDPKGLGPCDIPYSVFCSGVEVWILALTYGVECQSRQGLRRRAVFQTRSRDFQSLPEISHFPELAMNVQTAEKWP